MTQAEDEALATRLQQQYRMEFLQRQSEKQYQQNNSLQWGGRVLASAPSAPPEVEIMYQDDQNDEEYARNLQMQLDREASTTHNIHSFSNNQVTNVGFEVGTKTDKDDAKIAQELQDEELARQYHVKRERPMSTQELQDEDIARQLAYEQEEAARRSMEQEQMYPRRRGWSRRICPLITLAIAITVPLLFVFGVFTKEHFGLDNFGKDWIESDPWGDSIIDGSVNDMIVGEDAVRWRSNGNGLKLQILNALDPKYDQFLEIAVENWDNGYPVDPLTLSIKNGEYDFDCSPLNGVLKVCNGDYGATNWRGLNEVGLNRDRIIVYSTAKLNDFYLDKESDDQKLYTACHEIGHGLGLPHWDTNFNNKDLGNCMDYTVRPQNNKTPNESNFNYLAQLYGGQAIESSMADTDVDEQQEEKDEGKKGKDKGKGRRRKLVLHKSSKLEVHYIDDPEEDLIVLRHYHLN